MLLPDNERNCPTHRSIDASAMQAADNSTMALIQGGRCRYLLRDVKTNASLFSKTDNIFPFTMNIHHTSDMRQVA